MEIGHFYYIDDQYFKDFPDPYLMQNKEKVNEQLHDRPCFYAFQDSNTQLFWMIPFSSHRFLNLRGFIIRKCKSTIGAIQLFLEKYLVMRRLF